MEYFGEKLRRLRGDRPQKSVAEELGIPQTTLSSLEKQQTIPRGEILSKLTHFFGVSIGYFYDAPAIQSSAQAKAWLEKQIRGELKGRDSIATHSAAGPLDSETRKRVLDKIKEKYEESSNKDK